MAASSPSCKRSRPPSNLVNGQELTMCDIVWMSPQSHNLLSVKPQFLWHALQWPWPVRKRFSSDHWRRWRSKPGSRIVGSTTKVELTTVADCHCFVDDVLWYACLRVNEALIQVAGVMDDCVVYSFLGLGVIPFRSYRLLIRSLVFLADHHYLQTLSDVSIASFLSLLFKSK